MLNKPLKLTDRISLIDDYDLSRKERTGTYVIKEENITLIETCASPSVPYIIDGLKHLNIDLDNIQYIIVTHIHLDHAGGAGLLLEKCPNATIVVHPKGARHLANPSRLIAGAKAVYGEKFKELFEPIIAIPEDRMIIKKDGETLRIGRNSTLTFYDTPGHANHHFCIHDHVSNGIFTGDTIGIFYQELLKDDIELYLPSTSPNQFNPDAMLHSANRIESFEIETIYFGHFGMSKNKNEVFRQLRYWLPLFVQTGRTCIETEPDKSMKAVSEGLFSLVSSFLDQKGISRDHTIYPLLHLDLEVCAMGIVDYLQKENR